MAPAAATKTTTPEQEAATATETQGGRARASAKAAGAKATATGAKGAAATTASGSVGPNGGFADPRTITGLTFERRWTTPGVHPYDELEWEIRSASISNESGKVVFEQTDVEVPKSWSQLATNVVVSKYFRGHIGTPQRERSVKQLIDRVVNTICGWAATQRYFRTDADLDTFRAELTHLLVNQKMSFNSPVWFNVGVEPKPQCSACFINSVEDTMSSIMDLAKTEAMLFKYGSGAGVNLSTLRGSMEHMTGGGIASGPVSFMKGFDAFAGVVKSGGKTRRAAKMVILDVDHPDVLEFIESKAKEEQKAWALIEAGYDPSFTGEAYASVFFQNANHSVRVTDEYMRAVERDGDWTTRAVTTREPVKTYKARELFRKMAEAAHLCGDPGMQYDTTINDWHTCANTDRIYASNPCVTGDTLVATDQGWRTIASLVGEAVNVIGSDGQAHPVNRIFPTGRKQVYELKTRAGYRVRITADHRVPTNRGDVPVGRLVPGDRIALGRPGFGTTAIPERLALGIGLATGDGMLTWSPAGQPLVIVTMHRDEARLLEAVAAEVNAQKRLRKVSGSVGRNDEVHVSFNATGSRLAFASRPVVELFMQYAVLDEGSSLKRFKPAAYDLDRPSMAALLRGLFTADGTVGSSGNNGFVELSSTSLELLLQVQRMLLGFGIKAKLYENRRAGKLRTMLPDGKGGSQEYAVQEVHSLRITRSSRRLFEQEIGFAPESAKSAALAALNATTEAYADRLEDEVASLTAVGEEDVFDLTENVTHYFVANGFVVANCSEYMFLNDTACNLASLNLMKFVDADGEFDVEAYRYACKVTITAQEILVDNASYPTPRIEENSHRFRPLGLGYANLGALLMSRGLAYDSDEGRNFAAALTAIMTGEAYRQSAIVARDHGGPFVEYKKNEQPMLRVIGKHRDAAYAIPADPDSATVREAAARTWDEALELGRQHGYRNSQVTVLAPTGTIAFMMDCDTTGIEPDIALIKYKKLVGEGFLKIVNNTVPGALRKLGYTADQVEAIVRHIDEHETIEGAPELKAEHLPVFDCAFKPVNGQRSIHYMGHVRMMAATQPFLSGAISKTVNMPEAATPEDIADVYLEGWKLGLKAIAIYRDGSKRSQPLSTGKKKDKEVEAAAPVAAAATEPKPYRRRLPAERQAVTHKFEIAGHEGYITVGLYADGQPGEIFLKMAKEGSTVSGLMDSFATSVSLALQYGVPLRDLVNKFAHVRFEPAGFTGNNEIPIAKSIVDYIFRWLGSRFLPPADRENLGLIVREPAIVAETPAAPAPQVAGASQAEPVPTDATQTAPQAEIAPAAEPVVQPDKAALPAAQNGHTGTNGKTNGSGMTIVPIALGGGSKPVAFQAQADAPSCADCGSIMIRNGSCYKCLNCGSTSGCS
ncbi:MAG TPA: LAGLIDADG family homing endonuclease [Candidatus Limnocylindrales bacterium]|nr:LAGLIDADG family homing endonuclease [Candidatus Limnocylindrales bacterium]